MPTALSERPARYARCFSWSGRCSWSRCWGLSGGFTDKWLAGNLLEGPEHLAAVGLVAYCLGFPPGLFAIPAVAATALVARSVGAGDLPGESWSRTAA